MHSTVQYNKIHIEFAKSQNVREKMLLQIFASIGPLHSKLYRHRPTWHINTATLLQYPSHTLGHNVGQFLHAENLEPIPHAERHDVFHVLLQYNSSVQQEAAMQFCILGAGKKSPSVIATVLLAMAFLPEYWQHFYNAYKRGKQFTNFYTWPFEHLLNYNLHLLRNKIKK